MSKRCSCRLLEYTVCSWSATGCHRFEDVPRGESQRSGTTGLPAAATRGRPGRGRCVAYVCVHSPVFYEAASILEAVDAAFKSMFVLGLVAVDVWTADFLQHIPQLACLFRYTFFIFLANNVKALKAWVIQSNCRKQNCGGKLSFVVTSFISTVQRMFSTTGLVANSKTSSFSADKLHRMAFIH